MYDVIIVGAGPAGLMTARKLKDKANFLIIDQTKEVGLPLRCGEGIREKEFLQFFKHKNYPFVKNAINYHQVIYQDLKRTFSSDFLELDRPQFEQWLAQPLKNNLKLKTKCRDINIKKDFAEVITNQGTFQARLVILTYGCNFQIQKKFNLIKKIPQIVAGYGGLFQNHQHKPDTFYYYFDSYGYFWIFPKDKNLANIGFGAFKATEKINIKETFGRLVKKFIPQAQLIKPYAGCVPCSGPLKQTYYNRLLLCGNAAGQVHAGVGEGIYYALEAGQLAAQTALQALQKNNFKKSFLKRYEKLWKKSFGREMKAGTIFSELLFLGFKYNKIESLFQQPSAKEIHNLVLGGRVPFRAVLAWRLSKFFNLINNTENKKPWLLKLLWRISSKFKK
jgi:digeranylgeranylglycerophospholipid reductase